VGTAISSPENGTIIAYEQQPYSDPCGIAWCPGRLIVRLGSGAVVAFGHVNPVTGIGPNVPVSAGQEIATVACNHPGCPSPTDPQDGDHVEFMYDASGSNYETRASFIPPSPVTPANGCPHHATFANGGTGVDPCVVLTNYMHSSLQPSIETNLLKNASFELSANGTPPVDWGNSSGPIETYCQPFNPGQTSHDGHCIAEANSPNGGNVFQDITNLSSSQLAAGNSYDFSVWLRSETGQPFNACVNLFALPAGSQIGDQQTCQTIGSDWTLLSAPRDIVQNGNTFLRAAIYLYTANLNLDMDGATLSAGSAQVGQTAPGPPTNVSAVPDNGQATVSWSSPSTDGGSPISSYTITPSPACPACTGLTVTGNPPGTQTTVGGLTNGVSYTFTVTATNGVGPGAASGTSNAVTPHAPVSVTSLKPTALGQGATKVKLAVLGSGFQTGANVSVGGTGATVVSTAVTSATQLTLVVSVSLNASVGSRDVTVTNPDTGTATCTGCLSVNPGPKISSLSQSSFARGTNTPLTITGTGFVAGAKVLASGTGVTLTGISVVNPTMITVTLTVSSTAPTGSKMLTVQNPDHGTGGHAITVT
jgi:hypothetical protein